MPPLGENTPEGWACTGPLLERFGLSVIKSPRTGRYACGNETVMRGNPDGEVVGDHPHPCAAIAEWVAQYGAAAVASEPKP